MLNIFYKDDDMKREFSLRVGVMVFFIFWCTHGTSVSSSTGESFDNPLINTSWRLVEFQSMDDSIGIIKPDNPSLYTMHLIDNGIVSMRLNCNQARGQWTSEPGPDGNSGRFEFGQLAVTRALCPPPSMDESIASQSSYIRSYLLKDDKLYLSLMADAGIYVWETLKSEQTLVPPVSPEKGGPRNWEVTGISSVLNLRQTPSTSALVTATFSQGVILDNLGCQESEGRYWCYVQEFGGGPVGFVAAEYLKPAVSPNGTVMKGPDDSALRAGKGMFDAMGKLPCAQYRGQPMRGCEYGVARAGGGYATVVVKMTDEAQRALFFRMGTPVGADTSQADGYPEFRSTKENDLHMIRVGDERYEIPDAVIFGD